MSVAIKQNKHKELLLHLLKMLFKGLKWIFSLKLFSLSGQMKLISVTPGKNRKEERLVEWSRDY